MQTQQPQQPQQPQGSGQAFYKKLIHEPKKVTWFQIFQGMFQRHSQKDADYAMIAGTTLDSVNDEMGMLQKWQRPWLFRRVLLAGAGIFAVLFCAILLLVLINGYCSVAALSLLYMVLMPCIVPVALMVFFWEMNAPRNVTLMDMMRYFFAGGVLSILATMLFTNLTGSYAAFLAPVTEEPAKLLASLFFLRLLQKKKGKVYGLTGLAVGAAVGAGFAAFESAQYAYGAYCDVIVSLGEPEAVAAAVYELMRTGSIFFNDLSFLGVTISILLRSLCSICMHVLYCAPYAGMAALYMGEGMSVKKALTKPGVWVCFAISFFVHMIWNGIAINLWLKLAAATLVLWATAGQVMRLSFAQLAARVPASGNAAPPVTSTSMRIQGVSGVHGGISFQITSSEVLVGSDAACRLNYPINTPGIAPQHCKLLVQNGAVYLADLGSQSGTWLNGVRCRPSTGYLLKSGDTFYLGSPDQSFRIL